MWPEHGMVVFTLIKWTRVWKLLSLFVMHTLYFNFLSCASVSHEVCFLKIAQMEIARRPHGNASLFKNSKGWINQHIVFFFIHCLHLFWYFEWKQNFQLCWCLFLFPELKTNTTVGHHRWAGKHRLPWQWGRGNGDIWAEWDAPHAARRRNGWRGDRFWGRMGLVSWWAGRFLWDLPIAASATNNPSIPICILDTRMDCLVQVMDSSFCPTLCIVAVPLNRPIRNELIKKKSQKLVRLC